MSSEKVLEKIKALAAGTTGQPKVTDILLSHEEYQDLMKGTYMELANQLKDSGNQRGQVPSICGYAASNFVLSDTGARIHYKMKENQTDDSNNKSNTQRS